MIGDFISYSARFRATNIWSKPGGERLGTEFLAAP
jgi:hypothetical protein